MKHLMEGIQLEHSGEEVGVDGVSSLPRLHTSCMHWLEEEVLDGGWQYRTCRLVVPGKSPSSAVVEVAAAEQFGQQFLRIHKAWHRRG